MTASPQPATLSRTQAWTAVVSMTLVSLISYIDRNTLALLAPTILRDTHMTAEQYGWVISAFSVTYMIGNPLWGRLLDRTGVRRGMLAAVSFWTAASAAHAWAGSFGEFAIARALLGFGEGATFPGGLRTVVQTLPERQRSRGISVAYSGGSLGAVVTPLLITPFAVWFGWRAAFLATGAIGLAWLVLWWAVSRPLAVPRQPVEYRPSSSCGPRVQDPAVWAFLAAYALGSLPLAFVLYGAALYLGQTRGASQALLGKLLWIPPLGWELGYFVWGWVADRQGRDLTGFGWLLGAAAVFSLPLIAVTSVPGIALPLALMFFSMFVAAGFIVLPVAYAVKVYSIDHAGLLAGLGAGGWSAVVALVMPWLGRLFDARDYGTAFAVAAVTPLVGYLLWRVLSGLQSPPHSAVS